MQLVFAPGLGVVGSRLDAFVNGSCSCFRSVHTDKDINGVVVDVLCIAEDAFDMSASVKLQ